MSVKVVNLPEFGNLPVVCIENDAASAKITLMGAHALSYIPKGGEELFFLSEKSYYAAGKSIRGGIPVCWPWFGPADHSVLPPEAGSHGFVRQLMWTMVGCFESADATQVILAIKDSDESKKLWPGEFLLFARFTVGKCFSVALETTNCGDAPMTIGQALHTYFKVGDVAQLSIDGFDGLAFTDKAPVKDAPNPQQGTIRITGETDRVYQNMTGAAVINDPVMARRIIITKSGSNSSVVWNPWIAKSISMKDFGDEEYPGMICVETTNALEDVRVIAPGECHTMTTTYRVEGI